MSNTITPAQFAETVDSDGRTVRKFLRSITPKDEQPGKGSRWALPAGKRELTKLSKQFSEWSAKQAEEKAARAEKAAQDAAAEINDEDADLDA